MQGFHNRGELTAPEWAWRLRNYYWSIRVEGRDKSKRRKYYRKVEKEKLTLVESGIDINLVNAVCKYLIKLDKNSQLRVASLMNEPSPQLQLPLIYKKKGTK